MTSSTSPTVSTSTPTAEELLRSLLDNFMYVSEGYKGITWSFIEGVTIESRLGPEYQAFYIPYMKEKEQKRYQQIHNNPL